MLPLRSVLSIIHRVINYNLPLEERTHVKNMICVGVIPGPQCPADINSFLQPLINELRELARGVATVDVTQHKLFALHAHILAIFGDIPALTKILEFIGHNGCLPCRFCLMPTPNGFQTDPLDLPLRIHDNCITTGLKVLKAKNETKQKRLATESGIKGVTLFARVPSISVPRSFPVDLMHMIWLNLIPQLIDFWTGNFNDLDNGLEDYQLDVNVWDALCEVCVPSRRTIPTSFGCPVPDPRKRSQFIAETWNVFTTQLGPSILRKRFSDQHYYQHFVRLVKLLRLVVSFDLPRDQIPEIRQGFAEWIQEYEQIYYQFDEDRLQTCSVNTHYLLHIADSIEYMGPIRCYWAYPMERFCSFVLNSVKSRRYPYANIDERVLNRARLQIILHKYQLIDKEPFSGRKRREESDGATLVRGYPNIYLLSPHGKLLQVDRNLRRQIVRYLTTCFEILSPAAEELIPDELEQWGRLRIGNGGDEVHARGYHKLRSDGRDAAFYELMVDQDADNPSVDERLEPESQYGELRHIFVLTIPPKTPKINPHCKKKRHLLLAQIYEAKFETDEADEHKVIWYKAAGRQQKAPKRAQATAALATTAGIGPSIQREVADHRPEQPALPSTSVPPSYVARDSTTDKASKELKELATGASNCWIHTRGVNEPDLPSDPELVEEAKQDAFRRAKGLMPEDLHRPDNKYPRVLCLVCLRTSGEWKTWVNSDGGIIKGVRKHMTKFHGAACAAGCRAIGANHVDTEQVSSEDGLDDVIGEEVTAEGLARYIAELVADQDLAFNIVQATTFRRLLCYVGQGNMRASDIPERRTVAKVSSDLSKKEKEQLKEDMRLKGEFH
ncbi:transposase family Tnp2 protein, partial [Rhizoctonia solani AG-3 Rhs1AP]